MAERQGLLCGPHISEVRSAALNYLLYLDAVQAVQDRVDRYKFALISRDNYSVEKMFPEYNADRVVDDESEAPEGEEAGYDYEAVEWSGPSDVDQQTLNKMLSLLGKGSGAIDGNQVMNANGGEWV